MLTIKLPRAHLSAHTGTVRKWHKKPGESVGKGELLLEVETDAGLMHVESPAPGTLKEILLSSGQTGAADSAIAILVDSDIPAAPSAAVAETQIPPAPAAAVAAPSGKVIPILMPKAGQSMEDGTINKWHVKPGDVIKKGQVIFEIETDKANMDVEAPDGGRLSRITVGDGGFSLVLQPVGFIADNDADVDTFLAGGGAVAPATPSQPVSNGSASHAAAPAQRTSAPAISDGGRVKASPAARKLAAERGISLSSLSAGVGPGGRILSSDIPLTAPAASKSAPTAAGESRRRMSQMRRAIAKNLTLSKQTIPHFYIRLTIDAGPAMAFYKAQKELFPCSINDVIVLATGRLISEFPAFRSRIDGDEIVESPDSNVGIAVGMDDGLVVPVLLGAQRYDFKTTAEKTKKLAVDARSGKIAGMGMGSFTITNLGMFGTEEFSAIINPPETAILAVGAARETVIVKDGAFKLGRQMTLTLSADHRVIDGMLAAKFLARMKELLEAPEKIV